MIETFAISSRIHKFREAWVASSPLSHVVVPNFLDDAVSAELEFPPLHWTHWEPLGDAYQLNKYFCSDIALFPATLQKIFIGLSSPDFLGCLERVTGISGLIPDPYLMGGGLHLSTGGGILAHHTDFHIYRKLGLYRRLNLLIYLNSDWNPSQGGALELFHEKDPRTKILVEPVLNQAVLFETNDESVHGFASPVEAGCIRKSLAVYYYTSIDTSRFGGDRTTYWRDHPISGRRNKFRLMAYLFLLRISRSISLIAQVINPNQGLSLLKSRLRAKHQRR